MEQEYRIVNKNRSYGMKDRKYANFSEAKEDAILESAFTGSNFQVFRFEPILSLYLEVK